MRHGRAPDDSPRTSALCAGAAAGCPRVGHQLISSSRCPSPWLRGHPSAGRSLPSLTADSAALSCGLSAPPEQLRTTQRPACR